MIKYISYFYKFKNDSQDIKINLRAVKRCNFLLSMHISNEKLINSNLNDLHTRKTEDQDSTTKGACQFIPRQNYKIVIKCRVVVLCTQSVFYENLQQYVYTRSKW